jgi:hypothetical protein
VNKRQVDREVATGDCVGISHLTLGPLTSILLEKDLAVTTKLVDNKGRLMLGNRLAGRMVIVDDSDPNRIVITPAVAIPEREAWLYKNAEALNRVRAGLEQARRGQLSANPPDLEADADLANEIAD